MHAADAVVLFFIYRANVAEFQLDLLIDSIDYRLKGRFGRDGVGTSERRREGNVCMRNECKPPAALRLLQIQPSDVALYLTISALSHSPTHYT
jgi:hypothetical protein